MLKSSSANRWKKAFLALGLAFGGSFLLAEFVFEPSAPMLRFSAKSKFLLFTRQLRQDISVGKGGGAKGKTAGSSAPWVFYPGGKSGLGNPGPTQGKVVGANPKQTPGSTYPTVPLQGPTFNPDRRITPIPAGGGFHPIVPGSGSSDKPPVFSAPTDIPTQPPGSSPSDLADTLLELINNKRRSAGSDNIVFNDSLNAAAQKHADTVETCGHKGPDNSNPFDRAKDAGYPAYIGIGENIACGMNTAQRVVEAWSESKGHNENMIKPEWKSAGIGIARGYWVFMAGPV